MKNPDDDDVVVLRGFQVSLKSDVGRQFVRDCARNIKLQDEERRAEVARNGAEEKERQAASQQAHYDAMRRHDEMRRGIKPDANGAGQ